MGQPMHGVDGHGAGAVADGHQAGEQPLEILATFGTDQSKNVLECDDARSFPPSGDLREHVEHVEHQVAARAVLEAGPGAGAGVILAWERCPKEIGFRELVRGHLADIFYVELCRAVVRLVGLGLRH